MLFYSRRTKGSNRKGEEGKHHCICHVFNPLYSHRHRLMFFPVVQGQGWGQRGRALQLQCNQCLWTATQGWASSCHPPSLKGGSPTCVADHLLLCAGTSRICVVIHSICNETHCGTYCAVSCSQFLAQNKSWCKCQPCREACSGLTTLAETGTQRTGQRECIFQTSRNKFCRAGRGCKHFCIYVIIFMQPQ